MMLFKPASPSLLLLLVLIQDVLLSSLPPSCSVWSSWSSPTGWLYEHYKKGLLMVEELSAFSLVAPMWPFCLLLFSRLPHMRNTFGSLTISLFVPVPPATPSVPVLWERDSFVSALLSSLISWLLIQPHICLIEHGDLFLNADFPSSYFSPLKTPFLFSNAAKNSQ